MKKENLLILFIFSLLITGMALEKQYPTKQLSFKIDDKCPKNVLEPSKDSSGTLVSLKRFKTFTINEKRKAISDKLRKI
jgi:hypothetical protein